MKQGRYVIIPAGGIGTRMGLPFPKQLLPFRGKTVIESVLDLFAGETMAVPVPPGTEQQFQDLIGHTAMIVSGGETRFQSVRNAFEAIDGLRHGDLVLIHDAARPFLNPDVLPEAWETAASKGAIVFGAYATDTVKQVDSAGWVDDTLDRRGIVLAQTPQIFRAELLQQAYDFHDRQNAPSAPTDEGSLVEAAGIPVAIFESPATNRKLTQREDLGLLQQTISRIGHGYDVHAFDETRTLYLGGVEIPNAPGLAGHSDADVVLHALIDAMLGATARGDIGQWFSDTDPSKVGIRSTEYLDEVWRELHGDGFRLGNIDITIQAQTPKLVTHIPAMRECIAKHLTIDPNRVNVKATTTEGLGFVGRKEGIAAHAVVLLEREESLV